MDARLFRVILPVASIEEAAVWYAQIFEAPGERVSPGRHYFDCGGTILACVDPRADGDQYDARPLPDYIYIAVPDLDAMFERVRAAGPSRWDVHGQAPGIAVRPWGERSFYFNDPFGNPICIVEAGTEFTGR